MKKRVKKQGRKPEFNEKIQMWSDRIGLIISIVLIFIVGVELVFFFR